MSPAQSGVAFPSSAQPPTFLTELVGRDGQVREVAELLGRARLVTLVGTGGSGKTRLAAAAASWVAERGGPTGWIDLAAVAEAELVPGHVASTLGLREHLSRSSVDTLTERIGTGAALLVLDNCEHLLAACEGLATALLRSCPRLVILATSREPLRIPGGKAWRVPPLEVPASDAPDSETGSAAAVLLFAQRAADALPGFVLNSDTLPAIARICRRVDGLPLAIELAAARVPVLPPAQLADRLDDMFSVLASRSSALAPRQRTLRGMMDWSYGLLSAEERRLFDALAVFVGGFDLEAAEQVLGGQQNSDGNDSLLDTLATLVDKSLVVMRESGGEARYALLEPVRQYAAERLARDVVRADAVRLHHAAWYTALAEQLCAGTRRHDATLHRRVDADHDNMQAALAWALAGGRADLALRLCAALRDYWRIRGHLSLGLAWSRRAADAARDEALTPLRARALVAAAVYSRMMGEYILLQGWLADAVAAARSLQDPLLLADALTYLGVSLRDRGALDDARAATDEAVTLLRGLDDPRGLATALGARASVALAEGDTPLARSLRTEMAAIARAAGDEETEAHALIGLGEVARMQGDLDHARQCNQQCLTLFTRLGDAWHASAARHNLGWIEAQSGRIDASLEAFSATVVTFRAAGNPFGLTLCLFGFARLLFMAGDVESAGVAVAAASAQAARVGVRPAAPADIAAYEETAAGIRRMLTPDAQRAAAARGAALTLGNALDWAEARLREVVHASARRVVMPAGAASTSSGAAGVARAGNGARGADTAAAAVPGEVTVRAPHPAGGQPDLRVLALGPLHILVAGEPPHGDAFASSRPRELLLLLLCHPAGLTREQVGLHFWPESSAAQVKNSFHVLLHRLRRGLGRPEWVVLEGERYRLDGSLDIDFDVMRFEAEVSAALGATEADATDRLSAAMAAYRGDFMEGSAAGDWHLGIRDRLRRLYCDGLLALAGRHLADGRVGDATVAYRTLLGRDPLREEAYRGLMICQARSGQRVQALQLYDDLARLLEEELGARPERATTALAARLQRAEPL